MKIMKNIKGFKLFYLIIISVLISSCDPISCGIIENKSDNDIELRLFVDNLEEFKNSKNYLIDTVLGCGKVTLKPEEDITIAFGSRIAAPVMKEDLKFDRIEIIIKNDTLCFNNSAFYYCMEDRTNWPFFAVRNWYFTFE